VLLESRMVLPGEAREGCIVIHRRSAGQDGRPLAQKTQRNGENAEQGKKPFTSTTRRAQRK
jgi:hypothetical protein